LQAACNRRIARFNTQPPEGGWVYCNAVFLFYALFQHTAARRRLGQNRLADLLKIWFQHTAARRRLAHAIVTTKTGFKVSTHSRPKAAGSCSCGLRVFNYVSTHSRPKAAGSNFCRLVTNQKRFNTQPPEGGWGLSQKPCSIRFHNPDFAKLPRKVRTRV